MIALTHDTFNHGLHRWTYFWGDRGEHSPELLYHSRWRGALSLYWRWPWHAAGGKLNIYLRTPSGEHWEW